MQPYDMVELLRHRGLEIDLSIIRWFIDIVSPNNDMLEHLQALLVEYPMIDTRAMGFPQNWQDEPLWNHRGQVHRP